ncbi:MAG: response regulator [Rubrivivax sp.]|nr:response regulator [Rubrivivax sp.]
MTVLHRVSLVGFGSFERATFDMFFRMAQQRARRPSALGGSLARQRAYVQTPSAAEADIVLVDAEDSQAVGQAAAWPGRCLSIGAREPVSGAVAHLRRPLNMSRLLTLLDELMENGMRLPEALHAAPAQPAIGTAGTRSSGPEAADEATVLVADGSELARKFMIRWLGRHGLAVRAVCSGEEALQWVAQGRFELVFLDLTMPGIDGLQTCQLIKKRPYPAGQQAPRVVMLTARHGVIDRVRASLAGCDAFLGKPLHEESLLRLIEPLLRKRSPHPAERESALPSSIPGP